MAPSSHRGEGDEAPLVHAEDAADVVAPSEGETQQQPTAPATGTTAVGVTAFPTATLPPPVACYVCGSQHPEEPTKLLLCASCDSGGAHLSCIDTSLFPYLAPEEEWHCSAGECALAGRRNEALCTQTYERMYDLSHDNVLAKQMRKTMSVELVRSIERNRSKARLTITEQRDKINALTEENKAHKQRINHLALAASI